MDEREQMSAIQVQLDGLEKRFDSSDERNARQLDAIFRKLDELSTAIHEDELMEAKKPICPQPGACLMLKGRIDELEIELLDVKKQLAGLVTWRSSILLLATVLAFSLTLFAPTIRQFIFGHP